METHLPSISPAPSPASVGTAEGKCGELQSSGVYSISTQTASRRASSQWLLPLHPGNTQNKTTSHHSLQGLTERVAVHPSGLAVALLPPGVTCSKLELQATSAKLVWRRCIMVVRYLNDTVLSGSQRRLTRCHLNGRSRFKKKKVL